MTWGLSVGPSEGGRARGRARRRRWGEAERAAAGRGGSAPAERRAPLPPDRELKTERLKAFNYADAFPPGLNKRINRLQRVSLDLILFLKQARGGRRLRILGSCHVSLLMVSVLSVRRCFSCHCQHFPEEDEFIDTVCLLSTYSQFMCYILHKVNLARGKLILQFFKANVE